MWISTFWLTFRERLMSLPTCFPAKTRPFSQWSLNLDITRHLFHLWDQMEHQASDFRVSGSRSQSASSRWPLSDLAEHVGICLSASSAPHQGSDQAVQIQCLTPSCGPSLADPALVSRPPGSVNQQSQAISSDGDSSQTTSVGQIPSGPRQATAACLEAVMRCL